jgi:hypothetical protein
VFISYASEDRGLACTLASTFEAKGWSGRCGLCGGEAVSGRNPLTGPMHSGISILPERFGNVLRKGGMHMRKIVTLLLAIGLLLGAAGSALANCGADHANTTAPPTERPQSQT